MQKELQMKKDNIVLEKSFAFAVRIVSLCHYLTKHKRDFVLSKQLLRSATSIGANLEEAMGGQSKKDFFAKLTIAYKEARETHYWLRLLAQSGSLEHDRSGPLIDQCEELLRIIGSIQRTLKQQQ